MNLQVFLEWFHRLDAFLAGIGLLALLALSLRHRAQLPAWLPLGSGLALVLVAAQGLLGALTVTRLLEASTVTAHLLTALLLVMLLSGLHQGLELLSVAPAHRSREATTSPQRLPPVTTLPPWWLPLTLVCALALLGQCVLGGSMASRWAADSCLAAGEGCRWLWLHRLGAWPPLLLLALQASASLVLPAGRGWLRGLAGAAALLVVLQVALGVLTLRQQLAVPLVTVAHQLSAALLVALCGALIGRSLIPSPFPSSPELVHG